MRITLITYTRTVAHMVAVSEQIIVFVPLRFRFYGVLCNLWISYGERTDQVNVILAIKIYIHIVYEVLKCTYVRVFRFLARDSP